MPTYNFAAYLPEAIESVINQSYYDFEFIIIDDCSDDSSADVIKSYANKDERIISSVNHENIGMVENWNLCLRRATGEYVKFLFGDDCLSSKKALELMVSVLDTHHNISLVASARNVFDYRSSIIGIWSDYKGKIGYPGKRIIKDCLIEQKNKIGEPSVVMFRKKHAERGFDLRYKQAVDLELWFHILEQGDFAFIEEPLCSFRIHSAQQTKLNEASGNLYVESFQLLHDYANKPYVHMSALQREYMHFVPVYSVWKLYKKGRISRQTAVSEIKKHYNVNKFYLLLPFYRLYKFIRRLKKD